jgi:hypothetical protein
MNELAAIPAGVLGSEFDELARERVQLAERHTAAWQALEGAEQSLPDARQLDREAVSAAMRAGKKRPERKHTQAANKAIEDAKEDLQAIKHALDANEQDTLAFLAQNRTDLLHTVSQHQEDKRGQALELLEQLSVALLNFGSLDSLRRWLECPTTPASGRLQQFASSSFRLDSGQLRALGASGNTGVPVTAVVDLLGERLESTSFLDNELLAMARAAGLESLTAVERRDTGGVALSGNPQQPGRAQKLITNLSAVGLTKFVLAKGRTSTQLIVALDTLKTMSTTDVLSLNSQFIEQALVNGKRVVVSQDEQTAELMSALRPDTSKARETERADRIETLQETRRIAEQRDAAQEKLLGATTT